MMSCRRWRTDMRRFAANANPETKAKNRVPAPLDRIHNTILNAAGSSTISPTPLLVILRSALFAGRRTYAFVRSGNGADQLHRSFVGSRPHPWVRPLPQDDSWPRLRLGEDISCGE